MIDNINPDSKFKALNAFVFCGSLSIGVMRAGYHVDRVLEISDDIVNQNAYHFIKNCISAKVIVPNIWEHDAYLESLNKKYDLMACNCPCSSLSQINRNANLNGKNNIHFYRLFNIFDRIEPKVFLIENAPTLIKLGFPILKDLENSLGNKYRFTIIRDYAGNHNVSMKRMRTLLIGWRKDVFDKIPKISLEHHKMPTIKESIGDLYNVPLDGSVKNHVKIDDKYNELEDLFKYVKPQTSIIYSLVMESLNGNEMIDKRLQDTRFYHEFISAKEKIKNNKNFWNKSPYKLNDSTQFPSLTSVTELLHPIHDRLLTVRELARIMNYPDDFEFYPDECLTPITQCIAQGVPANFIEYITRQIKKALEGNSDVYDDDYEIVFQHHTHKLYKGYSKEEFMNLNYLESDSTFSKI
jgi:DNA (cytosine-5)-methyltransferase 1